MNEELEIHPQEDPIHGQIQLYEMIAGGKPVDETLGALVLFIEAQARDTICTVLLLDEDRCRLWTAAAPNFPPGLSAAIDGSSIGPNAGSCGTAAFRGENVFVEDIGTDPLWADYRNVFLLRGLRACWSSPIFDQEHRVLGTFAMYRREPALPAKQHLRLLDTATRIASACVSRNRAEESLRRSEQQLAMIYENLPDRIFLLDVQPDFRFRFSSVNKAFLSANGLTLKQVIGKDVERIFPPSTHQLSLEKYRQAIQEKRSVQWEQETVHSNGKNITIITINPVFDERDVCTNLVGIMRDATAAKYK